jgi:serine/threonine-protein kinase
MPAKAPDFPSGSLLPGTKYRVVKQLGAGGMGVVYQVMKPPAIQGVLKLMSTDLAGHAEFRTRFFDEVRVLAQLDHPNIVRVFDYDSLAAGTPFYVMELLHGRTVRDVIAIMGTLPPRVAFEITRQLCEALHCAHTHDIPVVHRDIKPENVFLHAPRHGEPVVKLIDFGVVAVADRTHDGTFVGTWKYAAPEQIRGERATPATDIYAVGLLLYEMLSGVGPFDHLDSGTLVSQAHLRDVPAPVSKFAPWVPPSIVALIQSALSKDPAMRPRDAYAFAERLFELEWATNGKDPNDRTAEGPLGRVLTSVKAAAVSPSAPPRDRLGELPVLSIPPAERHQGPTLKGVGAPQEPTSPGEDALLEGLVVRDEEKPLSKRARQSDPSLAADSPVSLSAALASARPAGSGHVVVRRNEAASAREEGSATLDAPETQPADALAAKSTLDLGARARPAPTIETDTFASQESDARRPPKRTGRVAIALGAAVVAVVGGTAVLARVLRGDASDAKATSNARVETTSAAPPPAPSALPPVVETATATAPPDATSVNLAAAGGAPKPSPPPKGSKPPARPSAASRATASPPPSATAAPAPKETATPPPAPKRDDFLRGL